MASKQEQDNRKPFTLSPKGVLTKIIDGTFPLSSRRCNQLLPLEGRQEKRGSGAGMREFVCVWECASVCVCALSFWFQGHKTLVPKCQAACQHASRCHPGWFDSDKRALQRSPMLLRGWETALRPVRNIRGLHGRCFFSRKQDGIAEKRRKMKGPNLRLKLQNESYLLKRGARENKQILRRSLTVCISIKLNRVMNRPPLTTSNSRTNGTNKYSRQKNLLRVKYLPLEHYRPY